MVGFVDFSIDKRAFDVSRGSNAGGPDLSDKMLGGIGYVMGGDLPSPLTLNSLDILELFSADVLNGSDRFLQVGNIPIEDKDANLYNISINTSTNVLKLPASDFFGQISITATFEGTFAGNENRDAQFALLLKRPNGETIRRVNIAKLSGNELEGSAGIINTYVAAGATDPFVVDGFKLEVSNDTSQDLELRSAGIILTLQYIKNNYINTDPAGIITS